MACTVTNLPSFPATGCGVQTLISDGHIKHMLIVNKGEAVPDITDDVAIAAQITAGTMVLSPMITGTLPVSNKSDEVVENCQPAQTTTRDRTFSFESVRTDTTAKADFTFWNAYDNDLGNYTFAFIDCDDNLYVNSDFTASPSSEVLGWTPTGFVEPVWDNTSARKWMGELTFREPQSKKIDKVVLTADVKTAIGL